MVESNQFLYLTSLQTIDQLTILVQVALKKFITIKLTEESHPVTFTQQLYLVHQVGLDLELALVPDLNLGLVPIHVLETADKI